MTNQVSREEPQIPELKAVESISYLLDQQFRIPFTNIRFGLDPILGLFPVAGDGVGFLISAILILAMIRHGVSGQAAMMMIGNILLDLVIGAIPVLGIFFDVGYKANWRNYRILRAHYQKGKYQGSVWRVLIPVAIVLLLLLGLFIYGTWQLFAYLLSQNPFLN
jgi:hypothetical protein